jgi:hypothetical protein
MTNKIIIRTHANSYTAELDDSAVSNEIWLSLPFKSYTNMLGDEIYFEMPLDSTPGKNTVTVLEKGDIAYWPKVQAFCIFFGPTPLSGEDRKPVTKYPVVKIGRLTGDFSDMEDSGDRTPIFIEKA